MQWGLDQSLKLFSFRFNLKFNDLQSDQFLKDLFNSPDVRYILSFVTTFKIKKYFFQKKLGFSREDVSNIKFEKLRCS